VPKASSPEVSGWLVEASWEVANKVGGIYTVLSTKLRYAQEAFGKQYLPVGPYIGTVPDFLESKHPPEWQSLVDALGTQGIQVHYGSWQIPGKPAAVLLGWDGLVGQSNAIKQRLWERFALDSLGTDFYDIDQPLLWSTAVGRFVIELGKLTSEPVTLHAHEWLSGGAILAVVEQEAPIKTVFTTHATVLGRALSSTDTFIYNQLESFDPAAEATRLRVVTKHQLEALAAQNATVFTTVSTVTAREAKAFLGRDATVVENGLDTTLFPTYDGLAQQRPRQRAALDAFVSAYFFPSYRFDLSRTRYYYTMGRYEFKNKGYDIALEALGSLNKQLQEEKSDQTVVAFFFVPGDSLRLRPEVTRQIVTHRHLQTLLSEYARGEEQRIERELWDDVACSCSLMPERAIEEAGRILDQVRTDKAPPVSPFDLRDPEHDPIIQAAAAHRLTNAADCPVKLLFFPVYLDGFDGAFNLPIYDLASGCDLGIFASRYEPWGYTPQESVALGVPAVTSTLAGFGQATPATPGVFLLDRDGNDPAAEVTTLTKHLTTPLKEDSRSWVARRLAAYQAVDQFSWSVLYPKYLAVYQQAAKS
jgi:glycosyltransferase involved in cell wall biosynthesis